MVKPVTSKRRLFTLSKNQKENTPAPVEDQFPLDLSSDSASVSCRSDTSGNNWTKRGNFENGGVLATPNRLFMPMSERQQIALVKQMSSPSTPISSEQNSTIRTTPTSGGSCRVLEKRNERGETPLHLAAIRGDVDRALQLIRSGAEVSVPDYAGWTALHEACNRGYSEIVCLLLQAGAEVNAKGLDNDTPLHDACVNGHYKIVAQLLQSGADTRAINCSGKAPRDICRTNAILSLINQFDSKCTADNHHIITSTPPEFEGFPRDSVKLSKKYYFYAKEKMSRKTPPTKIEDKNTLPSVTSSSNSSSSSSILNTSSATSSSGPDSPRVTMRLPQVPRTPEKSLSKESKSTENEDVYEFRCTKDNAEEEKQDEVKSDSIKQETDCKGDKRSREDTEDEEKRKRKKDETFGDKSSKGVNGRPSSLGNKNQNATTSTPLQSDMSTPSTDNKQISTERNPSSPTSSSPKIPENIADGDDASGDAAPGAPKVPPLKIVLTSTGTSLEQEICSQVGKNGSNRQLPYVVSSSSSEDKDSTSEKKEFEPIQDEDATNDVISNMVSSSSPNSCADSSSTSTSCTTSFTTGVSSSSKIFMSVCNSSLSSSIPVSGSLSDKSGARITRSRGCGSSTEEPLIAQAELPTEDVMRVTTIDVVPPRKRKLKKVPEIEPVPMVSQEQTSKHYSSITNCYEMFFKIRKQVERRRKLLVPVQPKPPQGFKDYLMNRCSYALAGNNNAQMTPPVAFPPTTLSQLLKDLFTKQEAERHKLRLQHKVEKEKLVLSVEQEIIRVHGRAARALANQVLPFSACTILKDEEVYNVITPEQEEKDRNARSRYNGRLFLSWLQDVDDKWEKIKEAMVLRHHNEAESLHAVQKMDWEWKLKELSLVEESVRPKIEDSHVPIVPVSDFDLLPDING